MAGFLAGLGSAMKGIGGKIGGAAKSFGKNVMEKEKEGLKQKYGDSDSKTKKKKKFAEALAPEAPSPTIPRLRASD